MTGAATASVDRPAPRPDPAGRRVAVFAPNMANGGAERAAEKLAEGLTRRGVRADLVLAAAVGPRMALLAPDVSVVDLGARRVLSSLPALVRYLRRERPDAMVSVLDHANVVALWARRLARWRGRVVVVEQNNLSTAAGNAATARDRMMPRVARRFYPWADRVVGVSEGVADDLSAAIGMPRERVEVIFNPIVTPDIATLAAEPVTHPWFSDGRPVLVAAGRMRPQKDFPNLLRAVARVRDQQRDVRLVILGDGPDMEALVELRRELDLDAVVDLPGATPNPYAYMAKASAFVLSSRWEGLPTVFIEALACGAPVVATDCPSGPHEILDAGRWGALVPVGDDAALAAAIVRVFDGEIAPAPEASWKPYTLGAVVDRYLDAMFGAP